MNEDSDGVTTPTADGGVAARVDAARKDLSETVEALAHKADVRNRTRESIAKGRQIVSERTAGLRERAGEVADKTARTVADVTPDPVQHSAARAASTARAKASQVKDVVSTKAGRAAHQIDESTPEPVGEATGGPGRALRSRWTGIAVITGTLAAAGAVLARRRHRG